jgi:hypothetical protein
MPNLGAAHIGGYMDFIQQMLGLRNQRLQEEKIKAELRQQEQQQMMKMASQMSGQIGNALVGYAQKGQENQMAERLWQEYRGGGAAATTPEAATYGNVPQDASFAGAKLTAEGGTPYGSVPLSGTTAVPTPTRFTGGIEELKLRLGMEALGNKGLKEELERKNERERLDIAQGHLTLAAGREGRTATAEAERLENATANLELRRQAAARADEVARLQAEQKIVDDAYKTFNAASPKFKEQAKNAEAYHSNIRATLEGMSKPYTTQETYLQGLSKIDSLYAAAESQGLKVDRPKVASWEDMEAARQKQLAIDQANAGYWTWSKEAEQKEAARLQQELQGMPGYRQNPMRVNPESYLARPSVEEPVPPNPEEIRERYRAQTLVPTTTAPTQATMSAAEYKAKTGQDVAPGTVKVDAKGRRLLITQ